MVTGDNILTAICVGREAGLLSGKKVFVASIDQSDPNDQKLVWRENNKLEDKIALIKMSFKELEQRDLVNSFKELRDSKQK